MKITPAWKTHSAQVRTKHGIPASAKPWTSRSGIELSGIPQTSRVMDILDTRWALAIKAATKHTTANVMRKDLWVDISQDVGRTAARARGSVEIEGAAVLHAPFDIDCCKGLEAGSKASSINSIRQSRTYWTEPRVFLHRGRCRDPVQAVSSQAFRPRGGCNRLL
jgi:hypothetical protein